MSIIYKTTNLINGKFYVGQHFTSADDGYLGSGLYLKRVINKYGKENFVRETLEHCTPANVHEREIYWISELSATNQKIGYNIAKGGNCLSSEEISFYKKQYYKTEKGKKHKQESSQRLKNINKIYNWTGKNNPNYKNAVNGKGEKNPFYGKAHCKETKIKIAKKKSLYSYLLEYDNIKIKYDNSYELILFCINNKICTKSTIQQLIWRKNKLPHIFLNGWRITRKLIIS